MKPILSEHPTPDELREHDEARADIGDDAITVLEDFEARIQAYLHNPGTFVAADLLRGMLEDIRNVVGNSEEATGEELPDGERRWTVCGRYDCGEYDTWATSVTAPDNFAAACAVVREMLKANEWGEDQADDIEVLFVIEGDDCQFDDLSSYASSGADLLAQEGGAQ